MEHLFALALFQCRTYSKWYQQMCTTHNMSAVSFLTLLIWKATVLIYSQKNLFLRIYFSWSHTFIGVTKMCKLLRAQRELEINITAPSASKPWRHSGLQFSAMSEFIAYCCILEITQTAFIIPSTHKSMDSFCHCRLLQSAKYSCPCRNVHGNLPGAQWPSYS